MRVTNLLIGTTTLAIIVAAFVGMLSIQKLRSTHQRGPLRIVFDGSASGLRKGGAVNFDGVPAGEIVSIKLKTPHKIAALVMLDKTVPIRKDTAVGIEYQGLTGLAAISLVGGAPAAPPVPLDQDGVPVLTADWSEQQSIADTLHSVDKAIVDNEAMLRDTLLSFETSTESLKSRGEAIDSVIDKAENSFASFDNAITSVDRVVPGLGDGKAGELFEKLKSIRELADSFRLKSATVMEEGRRSLLDISEAASRMGQKSDAPAASRTTAPPRRQNAKRR